MIGEDMSKKHVGFDRVHGTGLALGALLLVGASMIHAQSFSPYSDFQAMSATDLQTLQVKLTYVGPQQEPTPTVAFTSPTNVLNLSQFVPFRRPAFNYGNDDLDVRSFSASVGELQAVIQDVGTLPNVTAGGATGDFLSFGLLNTAG